MQRIARDTKNAGLLRKLWAALDNDPFLIAEILARPLLADRLIEAVTRTMKMFTAKSAAALRTVWNNTATACATWTAIMRKLN